MIGANEAVFMNSVMSHIGQSIIMATIEKETHVNVSFNTLCFSESTLYEMMEMLMKLGYEIKDFRIEHTLVFFTLDWTNFSSELLMDKYYNPIKECPVDEMVLAKIKQIIKKSNESAIRYTFFGADVKDVQKRKELMVGDDTNSYYPNRHNS